MTRDAVSVSAGSCHRSAMGATEQAWPGVAHDAPLVVPVSHFRCTACRSPRVTFVTPGTQAVRSETGILVRRGVPLSCACLPCRLQGRA